MFSNLRTNSPIYILHKDTTPYIEIGQVISVSQPRPKYQTNNFMAPQEMVVDIVVGINGNNVNLQSLPANLDVADQGTLNGSLFISTSKDAMNSEISSMRQKSLDIINSVDHHKKVLQDCELLLQRLNPEFAEQKQQKQEIDMLKAQMAEMMSGFKDFREIMSQFKKENTKG